MGHRRRKLGKKEARTRRLVRKVGKRGWKGRLGGNVGKELWECYAEVPTKGRMREEGREQGTKRQALQCLDLLRPLHPLSFPSHPPFAPSSLIPF